MSIPDDSAMIEKPGSIEASMSDVNQTSHFSNGEMIIFDDFTSADIDRQKWNVFITGSVHNHEHQAYIDSPDTIYIDLLSNEGNGILVIQPRYRPGYNTEDKKQFDFISGRIDSKNKMECQYGTISARIKLSTGIGVWPAFWMNGSDNWPASGEIDIMENVGQPDWVNSAIHGPGYSGDDCFVERYYFPSGEDATKWHIYSTEWTPNNINFKVDERLFFSVERSKTEALGPWMFDNQKHIILNLALGGTYPFKVNNIHDPYPGLPEETIQLIRNHEVKMLVDWVKVIKL